MAAALIVLALCLPVTALIWQAGHLKRRLVWHTNQADARREAQAAEQKRWEEAMAARLSAEAKLSEEFSKLLERFNVIEARLDGKRVEMKRGA